ncbi:MAG: UDP-phosphate galactose phosphotransferase [Ramlibacter sp.]|jgi:Undecaprenyl-phosphate galactose phosphotransferase WbaP|nr:UDP-phosphate galactose phosphotransferase [Ramlibacter sp.]
MYRADQDVLDGSRTGLAYPPATQRLGLSEAQQRLKRTVDVAGALGFFVLFLPLYATVALSVRLTSKGPALYAQTRIGQNGRSFRFYKFRSMVINSEEALSSFLDSDEGARSEWETYQKLHRDPRITRVGRIIRRTSLDELPQFWNVLKGDMSLVGPRPCMPDQRDLYGPHWSAYCAVKPGITGLWQVSGRNGLTYQQRVQLDSKYVQNWSLLSDLKILAKTVLVVLTGHGSR